MKFRSRLTMAASPDIRLRLRTTPLPFDVVCEGAAELATGPIDLAFDAIPIAVRIPFHHHLVVAATVGPFKLRINPAAATLRAADLRVGGTIGAEGDGMEAHVAGTCAAEVEAEGHADALRLDIEEGPEGP